MKQLQRATVETLSRLMELLDHLDDGAYTSALPGYQGSTAGKHVRHVIGFYDCLFEGLDAGLVNYDKRSRSPQVETSRPHAIGLLRGIIHKVQRDLPDKEITLQMEWPHGACNSRVRSSFYRELAYNMEHAVHHMAIIRIELLDLFPEHVAGADFGVALSTRQYLAGRKPGAPAN